MKSNSTGQLKRAFSVVSKCSNQRMQNLNSMNSGTMAACRRLISDAKFMTAIFRHLENPHAMVRAKAFLLSASILAEFPQDGLAIACQLRLPILLERNLKVTRAVQHRYNEAFDYLNHRSSTVSSVNTSCSNLNTESFSTIYLAWCVRHLADLLVYDVIPTICCRIYHFINTSSTNTNNNNNIFKMGKEHKLNSTTTNNGLNSSKSKKTRPHSMYVSSKQSYQLFNTMSNSCYGSTGTLNHTYSTNKTNRTSWLNAFNCLPQVLASCGSLKLHMLLMRSVDLGTDSACKNDFASIQFDQGFCLLSFIAHLLDYWTVSDQSNASGNYELLFLKIYILLLNLIFKFK